MPFFDVPPGPAAALHEVVISSKDAGLYADPSKGSRRLWDFHWLQRLTVDSSRAAGAPPGWFPIEGTGEKKAKRGAGARPNGWISADDVLSDRAAFKKVTGCWPVKSATLGTGDYTTVVTFTQEGDAEINGFGDTRDAGRSEFSHAHVYIYRDIVILKSLSGQPAPAIFFGLDKAGMKLLPDGVPADNQENFPAESLASCEAFPRVSSDTK